MRLHSFLFQVRGGSFEARIINSLYSGRCTYGYTCESALWGGGDGGAPDEATPGWAGYQARERRALRRASFRGRTTRRGDSPTAGSSSNGSED